MDPNEAPEARVEAYYDALRAGDPLPPFFADDEGAAGASTPDEYDGTADANAPDEYDGTADDLVKFGLSERLVGYGAVAEGYANRAKPRRTGLSRARRSASPSGRQSRGSATASGWRK